MLGLSSSILDGMSDLFHDRGQCQSPDSDWAVQLQQVTAQLQDGSQRKRCLESHTAEKKSSQHLIEMRSSSPLMMHNEAPVPRKPATKEISFIYHLAHKSKLMGPRWPEVEVENPPELLWPGIDAYRARLISVVVMCDHLFHEFSSY